MIKLTKRETKQVIRAAERIASGSEIYSCYAIRDVSSDGWMGYCKLEQKYQEFYEMLFDHWADLPYSPERCNEETQNRRVLMLLTFAEVCGE